MGRLNEITEVKLQARRECPANREHYHHCLRFSFIHKVFSLSLAILFIYSIHSFYQYLLSTSPSMCSLKPIAHRIRSLSATISQNHTLPGAPQGSSHSPLSSGYFPPFSSTFSSPFLLTCRNSLLAISARSSLVPLGVGKIGGAEVHRVNSPRQHQRQGFW